MRADAAHFWAVVVAAGSGRRFGSAKQFERLNGERLVDRVLRTTRAAAGCEGIVAVVPSPEALPGHLEGADLVVAGGATRSASVRAGLAGVPESVGIVVVHDAARPLAGASLFTAVVQAVRDGADGAVPGVAVTDTIKRVGPAVTDRSRPVLGTLARDELVAVQTPQAFRASALRDAHASGEEATDDAALIERAGGRIVVVPGDPFNLKVTTRTDLALAGALLDLRSRP
ncbi:MAG: 2-C-methyl-D-erythritol 4-phosphate cytidylyltransferase [Acidimicrobiales bacterium]